MDSNHVVRSRGSSAHDIQPQSVAVSISDSLEFSGGSLGMASAQPDANKPMITASAKKAPVRLQPQASKGLVYVASEVARIEHIIHRSLVECVCDHIVL